MHHDYRYREVVGLLVAVEATTEQVREYAKACTAAALADRSADPKVWAETAGVALCANEYLNARLMCEGK